MKKTIYAACLLLITIFFLSLVVANIITYVNIPDAPPYLNKIIPNQSLMVNTPSLDAFNLNDYFSEDNGDNVTYSYLSAENVTISISSNGSVSFYPASDYIGISTTIFYATDPSGTAESNVVYLFVTEDTQAPQWYNPRINRQKVFQNSYVNFSTYWTDNYELSSFIFSINQDNNWVNSSAVSFSGQANTSIQREQISADPGSTVYWRIYASDSKGNWNVTDVQSFLIEEVPEPEETTGEVVTETAGEIVTSDLLVEPTFFAFSLKQGTSIVKVLKIKNTGTSIFSINVSQNNLGAFLLLQEDQTSFQLSPGESKDILLEFSADERTIPEQYIGSIIVISPTKFVNVPVLLDVNLFVQKLGINISLPKKIKSGVPFNSSIKISNLKDIKETGVNVTYEIKDFNGNILDVNETFVRFNDSTIFNATLQVPADFTQGQLVYYVRAYNNETSAIKSEIFEVGKHFDLAGFIRLNLTLILILVSSIIIAILSVRYRRYRDREKTLSLYLMLNELKTFIQEDKMDSALEVYIRIKNMYHEPIPKEVLKDKDLLKEELKTLAGKLKERENSKEIVKKEEADQKKEDSASSEEKNKEKSSESQEQK